ncbi:F-box/RNI/FBD-like domain protein [Trifolium medium]|uniref:F-box/RNI/FBD-like domain protein n=1 Tax=Trifolium medium TaxID=97028 RepID=A0A392M226_9FABA|nr:F-box/RNI/FBD-like domain protein [Trifolium medium]
MKVQHASVNFPSLKTLKLDIDIMDSQVAFLSGCPMLETLHIHFVPETLTKFPVPLSSKRLKFTDGNFSWTCLEIGSDWLDSKNYISVAKLGIIGNLERGVEAYLDVFYPCEGEFVDPIVQILIDDYYDLHLLLRHSKSKWPLPSPVLNYPEFCNLHYLKFILPCFNSNLLINVLGKCHMLLVLIIQSKKEEPPPLRTWEPQLTTVPKCLQSHLIYIRIEGYQGSEDELAFAEYILWNGLVLKTMLIFVDISMNITNKYHSLKRLTNIPKGSETCQLKFDAA